MHFLVIICILLVVVPMSGTIGFFVYTLKEMFSKRPTFNMCYYIIGFSVCFFLTLQGWSAVGKILSMLK